MTGKVLIVGAGGRLGQALCASPATLGLARGQLDIAAPDAIAAALDTLNPGAVINAAALAHVDACENDWPAALRANAEGPGVLAAACAARGAPLVHVSTDYVFGAEGHANPRRETDEPAPLNAYGRSKLEGERRVRAAGGPAVVARTAWLFGFDGDFLDRMAAIARARGKVQVTEQIGSPTPVAALAKALLALAAALRAGKALPTVLHVAGTPAVTRAAWVEAAFGADPSLAHAPVERVGLEAFAGDPAARPLGTPLDSGLFARLMGASLDWRAALGAGQSG